MSEITNLVTGDRTHVSPDERDPYADVTHPNAAETDPSDGDVRPVRVADGGSPEDGRGALTRRELLAYGGATAGLGAVAVAGWNLFGSGDDGEQPADPGTPTPSATDGPEADAERTYPHADRFETVVDVAARGGDPDGEEPINDVLESNLADDTLFFFPEGTYRIADLFVVQHHDNVGLVGPEATLAPRAGQIGDWLVASDVSRLLLEGLTVSNEADQTAVRTKVHVSGGENVVRDVSIVGFQDVPTRTHGFTLQVDGADTELRLDGVDLSDGARNGTGVFVHPSTDPGTLRLLDCRIENWYEQGLYGSSHGGPMYVIGGRYANNGKAQVRVGGGAVDTPGVVRDVTVRMTDPQPAEDKGNVWGIWLHEGVGTVVENCDVAVTALSEAGSSGAVVIGAEQGTTTIRDTAIRVDDSTFAIAATSPKEEGFVIPSMARPPQDWTVTVENVEITGSADEDVGIWLVDRPGAQLRDVTVDQGGADRDGIGLLRSPGAEISGLSCSTSGFPLVADVGSAGRTPIATLDAIETLERTAALDGEGGETSTESGTPTDEAERGAGTGDGRHAVESEDGRYSLGPEAVAAMTEWPALAVTGLESDRLHVRRLSDSALNPF